MIIYCCQTIHLDILRSGLVHRNFQADPPSFFVRQMYSSSYGDGTLAYQNTGRTLGYLIVSNVFFTLQNMLKDWLCKCDVYQQLECKYSNIQFKYFIKLLKKNFFTIQLLTTHSDICFPGHIT